MIMMYRNSAVLVFICLMCALPSMVQSQSPMEQRAYGPFKSWANVKQRFGAVGDGKHDDTRALQRALDSLTDYRFSVNTNPLTAYTVIYLPKGTYRLTGELKLVNKIGVSIIGEDPNNTTIIWDGPSGGKALHCNGSAYFKIARIQFNAISNGSTGIAIRWTSDKNSSNSYSPQMIEISECIFRSFTHGIGGGQFTEGEQDATNSEVSIRNCHFYKCTNAGIAIQGYNALDYWIWNCRFIECYIGVKNRYGNYHIYRSYFKNSDTMDVFNHHGYYTSIRKCYSDGSPYFSMDDGFSCNYFIRVFEGNYVKNSGDFPIEYSDYGYVTLVDNYFLKGANMTAPFVLNIVRRNGICKEGPYRVFSYHNYYPYAKPLRVTRTAYKEFDYSVGDYGYGSGKPPVTEKAFLDSILVPFATNSSAPVFEVPLNASADAVQKLINTASGSMYRGKKPIVHFACGMYYFDKTIVIPPGSDVQLRGDGYIYATRIYQARDRFKGTFLFEIKGPSNATIADLHIGTEASLAPNGILMSNVDQPGSTIMIDQMVSGADVHALVVDKLREAYVQKTNSYYSYNDSIVASASGGKTRVHLFGGQFGFANVAGPITYLAKDCWFEWHKDTAAVITLKGPCRVILDACRVASSHPAATPFVKDEKFTGLLALMNVYTDNFLSAVQESPAHQLFVINTSTERLTGDLKSPKAAKSKVAVLGVNVRNVQQPQGDILPPDFATFMKTVQSYSSGNLPRYNVAVAGRTNVYCTRVSFGSMKQAFWLSPK